MKLSETVRLGKISAINRKSGRYRVIFEDRGNMVSDWLPYIYPLAADSQKISWNISVGMPVLCLYSIEGQGFILGSYFGGSRVTDEKDLDIVLGDLSISYDDESGELNIEGKGDINITSLEGSVKIGDLTVSAGMESDKDISIKTSGNISLTAEGNISLTAEGDVDITGENVRINGEVIS